MPTLFYARDGRRGEKNTDNGRAITSSQLAGLVHGRETYYSASPPTFGVDQTVNPVAAFEHVVVEIVAGETGSDFPDIGFYLIGNISPSESEDNLKSLN